MYYKAVPIVLSPRLLGSSFAWFGKEENSRNTRKTNTATQQALKRIIPMKLSLMSHHQPDIIRPSPILIAMFGALFFKRP